MPLILLAKLELYNVVNKNLAREQTQGNLVVEVMNVLQQLGHLGSSLVGLIVPHVAGVWLYERYRKD